MTVLTSRWLVRSAWVRSSVKSPFATLRSRTSIALAEGHTAGAMSGALRHKFKKELQFLFVGR